MRREAGVLALRTLVVGLAAAALALALLVSPHTHRFALPSALFLVGAATFVSARKLGGKALVSGSLAGIAVAVAGALVFAVTSPGDVLGGVLLAAVALAAALRLPALLGRQAPRPVAWMAGREVPILVLVAAVAAWAVARPLATGADVLIVDWLAGATALLGLAALLADRAVGEWEASPGHRHTQRIVLRPDPRAEAWRASTAEWIRDGRDAEGYLALWRRTFERAGAEPARVEPLLSEAAAIRRGLRASVAVAKRREAHARLVRLLEESSRGRRHVSRSERM